MELVYLYIDSFKNIKKQEYNFHPNNRFTFADNNLILTEKDSKLLPNFFHPLIKNITAIIGKNGSGKSSVLEFILTHISGGSEAWLYDCLFIFLIDDVYNIILPEKYHIEVKSLQPGSFHYYRFENGKFTNNDNPLSDKITATYYSTYYDGELWPIQKEKSEYLRDISTNFLRESRDDFANQLGESPQNEDLQFRAWEVDKQLNLISSSDIHKIIEFKFPDTIVLFRYSYFNIRLIQDILSNETSISFSKLVNSLESLETWISDRHTYDKFLVTALLCGIVNTLNRFMRQETVDNIVAIIEEIIVKNKINPDIIVSDFFFLKNKNEFVELLNLMRDKLTSFTTSEDTYEINISKLKSYELAKEIIYKVGVAFYTMLAPFRFDWKFSGSKSYGGLSSGEKAFLSFYSRLYHSFRNNPMPNLNRILVLDEPDLGFHPEWQRTFLSKFVQYGTRVFSPMSNSSPFQVIITSHSPFIASDLPLQNIIYLNKSADTGFSHTHSTEGMENTFAANILTLLNDAYFLDGGYISEFAKSKINKIIVSLGAHKKGQYTEEDHFSISEIKTLIKLIGEPVIRNRLQEEYNIVFSKSPDALRRRIEELESELIRLKKYDKD